VSIKGEGSLKFTRDLSIIILDGILILLLGCLKT
jgi:hypothetical protein